MFLFKKEEKKLANAYDVWTEDLPYKPFIEYDLASKFTSLIIRLEPIPNPFSLSL